MIGRISGVEQAQTTGTVNGANAYRNATSPPATRTLSPSKPHLSTSSPWSPRSVAQGHYLNAATAKNPSPCSARGRPPPRIDRIYPERNGSGSAANVSTSPGISDQPCWSPPSTPPSWSATPQPRNTWAFTGIPSTIYLRQNDASTPFDDSSPQPPTENLNPGHVINPPPPRRQADAQSALNGLFLGLGAVALSSALSASNIMIISVLERTIGDRTARRPGRHQRPHPPPVPL